MTEWLILSLSYSYLRISITVCTTKDISHPVDIFKITSNNIICNKSKSGHNPNLHQQQRRQINYCLYTQKNLTQWWKLGTKWISI